MCAVSADSLEVTSRDPGLRRLEQILIFWLLLLLGPLNDPLSLTPMSPVFCGIHESAAERFLSLQAGPNLRLPMNLEDLQGGSRVCGQGSNGDDFMRYFSSLVEAWPVTGSTKSLFHFIC